MDEEESGNVFDLFRRAGAVPSPEAEPTGEQHDVAAQETDATAHVAEADGAEKQPYKATLPARSQRETRLRILYPTLDKVRVLSYSYLHEVLAMGHQWLSLIFTHTVIVLEGRHLDRLVDDLQDERVRALICFHPHRHEQPEAGEPWIRRITDATPAEIAHEKKHAGPKVAADAVSESEGSV